MKLVILADSYLLDSSKGVTGTQVQLHNLSKAFALKMQVHCLAATNDPKLIEEKDDNVHIHYLQAKNSILTWIFDDSKYYKKLDQLQADVLLQRGRSSLTCVAAKWCKRNNKKFIWSTNGDDSLEPWKYTKLIYRSKRTWYRKLILALPALLLDYHIHLAIKNTHQVVNQTIHQKQRLKDNYNKEGTIISSYYLPFDASSIAKEKKILWLATLNKIKQPELFIDLAKNLSNKHDLTFELAGGSSNQQYFDEIQQLASLAPNLNMTGSVPFKETFQKFASAKLFILTSCAAVEGVPNTIIQAMICGTPIISLNHDPNNWFAQHQTGICCHGDFELLTETVKILLDDEKRLAILSENARLFAEQKFTSGEAINQYLSLFNS